jgi:hypothetical protein
MWVMIFVLAVDRVEFLSKSFTSIKKLPPKSKDEVRVPFADLECECI